MRRPPGGWASRRSGCRSAADRAGPLDLPGAATFGAFPTTTGGQGDRSGLRLLLRRGTVPTSGIAGVTVAAEYAAGCLDAAVPRPAAIRPASAAPWSPGSVPDRTADLPSVRLRGGHRFGDHRAADPGLLGSSPARPTSAPAGRAAADFDAIRAVYDAWASAQNGPLSRRGVSFPATAEDFVTSFTGVTVALDETGEISGFASWERGQGFGEHAVIAVSDLLATSPTAIGPCSPPSAASPASPRGPPFGPPGPDLVRLFLPTAPLAADLDPAVHDQDPRRARRDRAAPLPARI